MEGSDIEDGELIESDSETGEKVSKHQDQSKQDHVSPQSAWTAHRGHPSSFAYRPPKPPGLSSDDDASEEEYGSSPCKMFKQKRTQAPGGNTTDNHPFNNPMASGSNRGFDAKMWGPMVEESKAKKRNNIWSNVIQDQSLSATIGNVAVDRGDIRVERSVESYDVHSKYLRSLMHEEDSNDSNSRATDGSERDCEEDMRDDKVQDNLFDEAGEGDGIVAKESFATGLPKPKKKGVKSRLGHRVADDEDESSQSSFGNSRPNTPCEPANGWRTLCDIESFGNDVDAKGKKNIKDRLGNKDSMDTDSAEIARQRRKRSHEQSKAPVRQRLGARSFDKQKLRPHIKVSASDSPEDIALGIRSTLDEPDHMSDTFSRVVNVIGGEKALELLYMTEDVEEAGGMMTMRGDRHRTPGGVYLQLLKEDNSVTPEDHSKIFIDQRQRQKKDRKDRQRRAREKQKTEKEKRLRQHGMHPESDLPKLPDKREAVMPTLDGRAAVSHEENPFDDDLYNDCEDIMLEAA